MRKKLLLYEFWGLLISSLLANFRTFDISSWHAFATLRVILIHKNTLFLDIIKSVTKRCFMTCSFLFAGRIYQRKELVLLGEEGMKFFCACSFKKTSNLPQSFFIILTNSILIILVRLEQSVNKRDHDIN